MLNSQIEQLLEKYKTIKQYNYVLFFKEFIESSYFQIILIIFIIFFIYHLLLISLIYHFNNLSQKTVFITNKEHRQNIHNLLLHFKNTTDKITLNSSNTTFNTIIDIDKKNNILHIGGNANLFNTLKILNNMGYCLNVTPNTDNLTIGELYSCSRGGATTFKYGEFFHSVKQLEIITGNGNVLITNENQHSDLFHLFPNSSDSLGCILSLWVDIKPIYNYVYSETFHYSNFSDFINAIETKKISDIDFLDGTIFGPNNFVLITGKNEEYINTKFPLLGNELDIPYYEHVNKGYKAFFHYHDYIYRWDVDGYYSLYENNILFKLFKSKLFRQIFFHKKLMKESILKTMFNFLTPEIKFNETHLNSSSGDFILPHAKCNNFFKWYNKHISLYPLYIRPITFTKSSPLLQCSKNAIDFGVGYGVIQNKMSSIKLLRKCMKKTYKMDGDILKYNNIYKNNSEFWKYYPNKLFEKYTKIKKKYDKHNHFYSIADKPTMK